MKDEKEINKRVDWLTEAKKYLSEADPIKRKATKFGKHIKKRLDMKVLQHHYARMKK